MPAVRPLLLVGASQHAIGRSSASDDRPREGPCGQPQGGVQCRTAAGGGAVPHSHGAAIRAVSPTLDSCSQAPIQWHAAARTCSRLHAASQHHGHAHCRTLPHTAAAATVEHQSKAEHLRQTCRPAQCGAGRYGSGPVQDMVARCHLVQTMIPSVPFGACWRGSCIPAAASMPGPCGRQPAAPTPLQSRPQLHASATHFKAAAPELLPAFSACTSAPAIDTQLQPQAPRCTVLHNTD
jgi:hypothetical protein